VATIGPSGVRALPLAAGINEGGHYFRYFFFSCFLFCLAQPQIQLSWAELALILKNPASARPGLVPEKLPRKLKFDMQASFNPTRTNIKKKWGNPPLQSFHHKTVISSQSTQGILLKNLFNKSCYI
jgi:hypothetical protein